MTVPFGRIARVVNADDSFREILELLRAFVRVVEPHRANKILDAVRAGLEDCTTDGVAERVQQQLSSPLPFHLQATTSKLEVQHLLKNEQLRSSTVFQKLMATLAAARKEGACGLLLFRVKHNGIFVAHNVPSMRRSTPRVVLPATDSSYMNIQIMPLETWAEYYQPHQA